MISRYITLEEIMKRFNLYAFLDYTAELGRIMAILPEITGVPGVLYKGLFKGRLQQTLQKLSRILLDVARHHEESGFIYSAKAYTRLAQLAKETKDFNLKKLADGEEAAFAVLKDEIDSHMFFAIEQDKTKFLSEVNPFGEVCSKSFPSTDYDGVEAGKCLVFERWTASVMHLMRVLEIGLSSLAKELGISMKSPNWQDLINQIEKEIKGDHPTDPNWKAKEQFYSEAAVQFRYLKNAWRNHAMHTHSTYDEERANTIFNSVKDFMSHLATKLQE